MGGKQSSRERHRRLLEKRYERGMTINHGHDFEQENGASERSL